MTTVTLVRIIFRPFDRHSLVLSIAGLYYIVIGFSFLSYIPGAPRWQALVVARDWMPLYGWTIVFSIAGLLAILSAIWPPGHEKWGYAILSSLSAGWAAIYAIPIITGATSKSHISSAATWALIAFLWWGISGIKGPVKINGSR